MKVVTYEAVVENGQVQLPPGVVLPEKAMVYVVVPEVVIEVETPQVARLASPRLADPAQAARFGVDVVEESTDAGL